MDNFISTSNKKKGTSLIFDIQRFASTVGSLILIDGKVYTGTPITTEDNADTQYKNLTQVGTYASNVITITANEININGNVSLTEYEEKIKSDDFSKYYYTTKGGDAPSVSSISFGSTTGGSVSDGTVTISGGAVSVTGGTVTNNGGIVTVSSGTITLLTATSGTTNNITGGTCTTVTGAGDISISNGTISEYTGTGTVSFASENFSLTSTAYSENKYTVTTSKGTVTTTGAKLANLKKGTEAINGVSQYYTLTSSTAAVLLDSAANKSFTFGDDTGDLVIPKSVTSLTASTAAATVDTSGATSAVAITADANALTVTGGTTNAATITPASGGSIVYKGGKVTLSGGTVNNGSVSVSGKSNSDITATTATSITFGEGNVLTFKDYSDLADTVTAFDRVSNKFTYNAGAVTAVDDFAASALPSGWTGLTLAANKKVTLTSADTLDCSKVTLTSGGKICFNKNATLTSTAFTSDGGSKMTIVTSGGTVTGIAKDKAATFLFKDDNSTPTSIQGISQYYAYTSSNHKAVVKTAVNLTVAADASAAGGDAVLPSDVAIVDTSGVSTAMQITPIATSNITVKGNTTAATTIAAVSGAAVVYDGGQVTLSGNVDGGKVSLSSSYTDSNITATDITNKKITFGTGNELVYNAYADLADAVKNLDYVSDKFTYAKSGSANNLTAVSALSYSDLVKNGEAALITFSNLNVGENTLTLDTAGASLDFSKITLGDSGKIKLGASYALDSTTESNGKYTVAFKNGDNTITLTNVSIDSDKFAKIVDNSDKAFAGLSTYYTYDADGDAGNTPKITLRKAATGDNALSFDSATGDKNIPVAVTAIDASGYDAKITASTNTAAELKITGGSKTLEVDASGQTGSNQAITITAGTGTVTVKGDTENSNLITVTGNANGSVLYQGGYVTVSGTPGDGTIGVSGSDAEKDDITATSKDESNYVITFGENNVLTTPGFAKLSSTVKGWDIVSEKFGYLKAGSPAKVTLTANENLSTTDLPSSYDTINMGGAYALTVANGNPFDYSKISTKNNENATYIRFADGATLTKTEAVDTDSNSTNDAITITTGKGVVKNVPYADLGKIVIGPTSTTAIPGVSQYYTVENSTATIQDLSNSFSFALRDTEPAEADSKISIPLKYTVIDANNLGANVTGGTAAWTLKGGTASVTATSGSGALTANLGSGGGTVNLSASSGAADTVVYNGGAVTVTGATANDVIKPASTIYDTISTTAITAVAGETPAKVTITFSADNTLEIPITSIANLKKSNGSNTFLEVNSKFAYNKDSHTITLQDIDAAGNALTGDSTVTLSSSEIPTDVTTVDASASSHVALNVTASSSLTTGIKLGTKGGTVDLTSAPKDAKVTLLNNGSGAVTITGGSNAAEVDISETTNGYGAAVTITGGGGLLTVKDLKNSVATKVTAGSGGVTAYTGSGTGAVTFTGGTGVDTFYYDGSNDATFVNYTAADTYQLKNNLSVASTAWGTGDNSNDLVVKIGEKNLTIKNAKTMTGDIAVYTSSDTNYTKGDQEYKISSKYTYDTSNAVTLNDSAFTDGSSYTIPDIASLTGVDASNISTKTVNLTLPSTVTTVTDGAGKINYTLADGHTAATITHGGGNMTVNNYANGASVADVVVVGTTRTVSSTNVTKDGNDKVNIAITLKDGSVVTLADVADVTAFKVQETAGTDLNFISNKYSYDGTSKTMTLLADSNDITLGSGLYAIPTKVDEDTRVPATTIDASKVTGAVTATLAGQTITLGSGGGSITCTNDTSNESIIYNGGPLTVTNLQYDTTDNNKQDKIQLASGWSFVSTNANADLAANIEINVKKGNDTAKITVVGGSSLDTIPLYSSAGSLIEGVSGKYFYDTTTNTVTVPDAAINLGGSNIAYPAGATVVNLSGVTSSGNATSLDINNKVTTVTAGSGADDIVYNGGTVTLNSFTVGTDKLRLADTINSVTKTEIPTNNTDALKISFNNNYTLTLDGVITDANDVLDIGVTRNDDDKTKDNITKAISTKFTYTASSGTIKLRPKVYELTADEYPATVTTIDASENNPTDNELELTLNSAVNSVTLAAAADQSDTIIYGGGDLTITNFKSADTIKLGGTSTFSKSEISGSDVKVTFAGTNAGTITFKNLANSSNFIEAVKFQDSSGNTILENTVSSYFGYDNETKTVTLNNAGFASSASGNVKNEIGSSLSYPDEALIIDATGLTSSKGITITGNDNDNTIKLNNSGSATNSVETGNGNDTIIYNGGTLTITDYTHNGSYNDIIQMGGTGYTVTKTEEAGTADEGVYSDLKITFSGSNNVITIENYKDASKVTSTLDVLDSDGVQLPQVSQTYLYDSTNSAGKKMTLTEKFTDTTLTLSDQKYPSDVQILDASKATGISGVLNITGNSNNNTFIGRPDATDSINGGGGTNTYVLNGTASDDKTDTVASFGASDVISITGGNVAASKGTLYKTEISGDNLLIYYGGNTKNVTQINNVAASGSMISKLTTKNASGTAIDGVSGYYGYDPSTTANTSEVKVNPAFRDTLAAGTNAGNYPTAATKINASEVTGALTVNVGSNVAQVIPSTVESAKGEGTYILSQIVAGGITFGNTSDSNKVTDTIQLTSGLSVSKTELAADDGNADTSGDNLKITLSNSKTILVANGKNTDLSFIDASNTAITAISGYYTYKTDNSIKEITLNSDYAAAKSSTLKSSDYASDIKNIDLSKVLTAMVVQGNALANTITAGTTQAHTLTGGEGKDVFKIGKNTTNTVVITDYTAADDVIQFAAANTSLTSYTVLDSGDLKITGNDGSGDTTVIVKDAAKSGAIIPSISLVGANGTSSLGKVSGNVSYEAHTGAADADKYAEITVNSNFDGNLQATVYSHATSGIVVRDIYAQDVKNAITIEGTASDNSIYGSDEGNTINGGAGNDSIVAGSGDDYINGGGGTGIEYIDAGAGDNRVTIGTSTQPQNTTYANTVIAGAGADIVVGSAGRDYVNVGAGANSVFAGDGNDSVYVEGNNDSTIYGGGGLDLIVAAEGSDYIDAGNDSDTINAGNGDNTVIGGGGVDIIQAGSGNDSIDGGNDNDSIYGGAGDDYINGGNGNDTIIGGEGDDTLYGGAGGDLFVYISGDDYYADYNPGQNDTIQIAAGVVTESGITEDGDVILTIANGTNTLGNITIEGGKDQKVTIIDGNGKAETRIFGYFYQEGNAITLNADYAGSLTTKDYDTTITGINASLVTADDLVINGNTTNNIIVGSNQNDLIFGDAGNDSIRGLDGDDIIDGGKDNDTIDGGKGNDSINGGDGVDILIGGDGLDSIYGGAGDDSINGGDDDDYIDAGAGDDEVIGGAGDDIIYGQAGIDIIDGGNGDDYIDGGNDNDSIYGGAGNNTLIGGAGNDNVIAGGDGDNLLDGGSGNDTLTGGTGSDTFSDNNGNDIFAIQLSDGGNDNLIVSYENKDYISIGGGTVYKSALENNDVLMTLTADDANYATANKAFVTVQGAKDVKMNIIDKTHTAANPLVQVFGYFDYSEKYDSIKVNSEFEEAALPASLYPTKVKYIDATAVENSAVFYANSAVATTILGGTNADITLAGDKNADSLIGGDSDDSLNGGAGNDTLINGLNMTYGSKPATEGGTDSMFGGAGNDVFLHNVKGDILIQDFKAKEDVIRLAAGESVKSSEINGSDVILNIAKASGDQGSITVAGASGTTLTIVEYTKDANTSGTTEAVLGSYSYKKNDNNKITEISLNSDFSGALTTNTYATSVTLIAADQVENNITINANAAGDSIIGSDNAETINGGAGKDTIFAKGGANYVYGNAGNDILIGDIDADYIDGGADDDSIYGGTGNNTLLGGAGNDSITGGTGDNLIDGGDGNDSIWGDNGANTILGGRGADTIYGGTKDDSINGGTENDYIVGGGGSDSLFGGTGNDTFIVGDVASSEYLIQDYTNKGTEKDVIKISTADKKVINSELSGNDVLVTVQGPEADTTATFTVKSGKDNIIDIVETEAGVENHKKGYYGYYNGVGTTEITVGSTFTGTLTSAKYDAENSNPVVVIDASSIDAADVNIQGNSQANSILGGDNNIVLFGGAGADSLIGGSGNDSLNGGDDNDSLVGGAGDDNLFGGKGDDTLVGNDGANVLTGSDGNDVFVYINGEDTITDYEAGKDTIILKNSTDDNGNKTKVISSSIAENKKDVILNIGEGTDASGYTEVGTITVTNGKDKKLSIINSTNTAAKTSTPDQALSAAVARVYGYYNLGIYSGEKAVSVNSDFAEKEFSSNMYGDDITVIDASQVNEGINVIGNVVGSGSSAKGTTLFGSANNDTFTGGAAADSVMAGEGDDLVKGGSGDDIIYGGDGDDKLYGEAGKDSLFAGAGANTLEGGNDADMFIFDSVASGENLITDYTPGQNDSIRLDDINITSTEISGKDVILNLSNDGTVTIKGGKDKIIGISTLTGGDTQGNPRKGYYGYVSWNTSGVHDANDSIAVNADFAEPELTTKMYTSTVASTARKVEYIDATAVSNDIVIRTDNITAINFGITVFGGTGADTVYGNAQGDSLFGGTGDDYIYGEDGADFIYGEGGDNVLDGGKDADELHGGGGNDTMTGGDDRDKFYYNGGDVIITDWTNGNEEKNNDYGIYLPTNASVTGSSVSGKDVILQIGDLGTITVKNGKGVNLIIYEGGQESTAITAVYGYYTWESDGSGNATSVTLSPSFSEKSLTYPSTHKVTKVDASQVESNGVTITADADLDAAAAGTHIIGSNQADKLIGADFKTDTLSGGLGNDTLSGGSGNDVFIYSGGKDVITDYKYTSSGEQDKIKLNGVSVANSSVIGKDVVFTFSDGGTLTVKNTQNKLIQLFDSDTELTENVTPKLYGYVDFDADNPNLLRINANYSASSFVAKDLAPRAQLTAYTAITAADVAKGLTINLTGLGKPTDDNSEGQYTSGNGISLTGSSYNDKLISGILNDTLIGGDGNDTMTGGAGTDVFVNTNGKDVITDYNKDEDKIVISDGVVTSSTLKSKDVILTIDGDANRTVTVSKMKGTQITVVDNNGSDTRVFGYYNYDSSTKTITLNTDFAEKQLNATDYKDDIAFVDASNVKKGVMIQTNSDHGATTVLGSAAADKIYADNGKADSIYAGAGNDLIKAGDVTNVYDAGDTLAGGAGKNTLVGADGNNVFVYDGGTDVIKTYKYEAGDQKEQDVILLNDTGMSVASSSVSGKNIVLNINKDGKALGTITVVEGKDKVLSVVNVSGESDTRVFGYYNYGTSAEGDEGKTIVLNAEFSQNPLTGSTGAPNNTTKYNSDVTRIDATQVKKAVQITANPNSASTVVGSKYADKIAAGTGQSASLYGGDGNDSLYGSTAADTLVGGAGNDTFTGGADAADVFVHTTGSDYIVDYDGAKHTDANKDIILLTGGMVVSSSLKGSADVVLGIGTVSGGKAASTITVKGVSKHELTVVDKDGNSDTRLFGYYSYDGSTDAIKINTEFAAGTIKSGSEDTTKPYYSSEVRVINAATVKKAIVIDGNTQANIITGGLGADKIYGGDEADSLFGGAGNDSLNGGVGEDTLIGGAGNDTLFGGTDNDVFVFIGGKEVIKDYNANSEADRIFIASSSSDKVTASTVKSKDVVLTIGTKGTITVQNAADKILTVVYNNGAGATEERLFGYYTYDSATNKITLNADFTKARIYSTSTMTGAAYYAETIANIDASKVTKAIMIDGNGLANNITASTSKGTTVDAAAGNDAVKGGNGADSLIGGEGEDYLDGGKGNDVLYGGNGKDSLYGGEGNDNLFGDEEDDVLVAGAGNDTLTGGDGANKFILSAGNDTITDYTTGEGNIIVLDSGNDLSTSAIKGNNVVLTTKKGTVTLKDAKDQRITIYSGINDKNPVTGIFGYYDGVGTKSITLNKTFTGTLDSVEGGSGTTYYSSDVTTINGSKVSTAFAINGNAQNNIITASSSKATTVDGGAGNDLINGGAGADYLIGGDGNDTINGGGGNDTISGGTGNNNLTGGAGRDVFVYEGGTDFINDYTAGQDSIKLEGNSITSSSISGANIVFNTSSGNTLTVKNAKGKMITVTDSSGNTTSQIYTNSSVNGSTGLRGSTGLFGSDESYWFAEEDDASYINSNADSQLDSITDTNYSVSNVEGSTTDFLNQDIQVPTATDSVGDKKEQNI